VSTTRYEPDPRLHRRSQRSCTPPSTSSTRTPFPRPATRRSSPPGSGASTAVTFRQGGELGAARVC